MGDNRPGKLFWTGEMTETLRTMAKSQLSASQIAARLGISHNAVLGKARRMGIAFLRAHASRPTPVPDIKKKKSSMVGFNFYVQKTAIPMPIESDRSAASRAFGPPIVIPAGSEHLRGAAWAVLSLGPTHCRFPVGDPRSPDFRFCGAPRVGKNYCCEHQRFDIYGVR
jgi:GcrA cell cycle regulator